MIIIWLLYDYYMIIILLLYRYYINYYLIIIWLLSLLYDIYMISFKCTHNYDWMIYPNIMIIMIDWLNIP